MEIEGPSWLLVSTPAESKKHLQPMVNMSLHKYSAIYNYVQWQLYVMGDQIWYFCFDTPGLREVASILCPRQQKDHVMTTTTGGGKLTAWEVTSAVTAVCACLST